MFKAFLATALVLSSGTLAHANDSAFAKIRVKAISPGALKGGKAVKFQGLNADKFFEMLPASLIAGNEQDQKAHASMYRSLTIESGKNAIYISCTKETTTECSISAGQPDDSGDSFDYEAPVCK